MWIYQYDDVYCGAEHLFARELNREDEDYYYLAIKHGYLR